MITVRELDLDLDLLVRLLSLDMEVAGFTFSSISILPVLVTSQGYQYESKEDPKWKP